MRDSDIQLRDMISLIDQYFRILDKKISENDKEILLVLKELKKIESKKGSFNDFNPEEIKIVSYLDS